MHYLLLIVLLIVNECNGSKATFKRVVNGVPLNGRPLTYSVIRYFGAIAKSHNFIWNYIGSWNWAKPSAVDCTGAILTPRIFQTACHCLAGYDETERMYLKPPIVANQWEGKSIIYLGISNKKGDASFETYRYVKTVKYLVHQKCARFGNLKAVSYDYGIILVDATWIKADDVPPTYPWLEIDFAPQYTAAAIQLFQKLALGKELVCLIVGFGPFERYRPEQSDVLRVGWAKLLSPTECYHESGYLLDDNGVYLSSAKRFNWVCSSHFPKHDQESAVGDSGGPLSCDNRHVAVLSGITFELDDNGYRINIVNKYDSIAHTLYTNAIEFRNFFIHTVDDVEIYRTRRCLPVGYDGPDRECPNSQAMMPYSR